MDVLLATAHTWRGGDGPISIAPIAGVLVSLLLLRSFLGVPVRPASLAIALGLGTVFATLGGRWGYASTVAAWIAGFAFAAAVRRAGGLQRNSSD